MTRADRSVVLDNGVVRAIGTHDELVGDPLYAEFAATQLLTGEPAVVGVPTVIGEPRPV